MNFYTIDQSAKLLQVTSRTVQNWTKKGILGFVKIGGVVRIPAAEIEALIAKHMVQKRSAAIRNAATRNKQTPTAANSGRV